MKPGYQKYALSHWGRENDAPEIWLVRDDVLDPFFDGVKSIAIPFEWQDLHASIKQAGLSASPWSWERTLNFAHDVWASFPAYQQIYDDLAKNQPVRFLPDDVSAHMSSGGRWTPDGVLFRRDGTISDPIYLTHENGHHVANRDGALPNVMDIQAFFAQHAAYDLLIARGGPDAQAARLHRFREHMSIAYAREEGLNVFAKGHADNDDESETGLWLHCKPFPGPLALHMYNTYQSMPQDQRKRALTVLFDGGAQTSVADILHVFGFKTPEDIKGAGAAASRYLADEAKALKLYKPHENTQERSSSAIPRANL